MAEKIGFIIDLVILVGSPFAIVFFLWEAGR